MKSKSGFLLTAVLLNVLLVSSGGQGLNGVPEYHLNVRIDPASSEINCRCEIRKPNDSCFLLSRSLTVHRITSGGKDVLFHQTLSEPFDSYLITIPDMPENIVIEYSGQILERSFPKSVSMLNMINEGLVELSDHINWYPLIKNNKASAYRLEVDVPSQFVALTNFTLKSQKSKDSRSLTYWESPHPVFGITLIAFPGLKKSEITRNGMKIEICYSRLPATYVDSMKNNLLKSLELLTGVFGVPRPERMVRVIYSPRSAGAYARAPLIVVSENYAMEQRSQKFGAERDFRLNTHEIAHYWSLADTNTPDDWINEGLAEYSALLVSEVIIGKDFSDMMVREYKEIVNNTQTEHSIVETPGDSRDREVNRYYKPALLLNDLKLTFGYEKMKGFLKDLYTGLSDSKKANTSVFLDILEKDFGKEQRVAFEEALNKKNWETGNKTQDATFNPSDSVFIGTWTGPLTQFGATVKFVLNINIKDGKFIPSLDSPDQNVTGIPLSDLIIDADSISFTIGVASARYRGLLDKAGMSINGEFSQRGGIYALNLAKEKMAAQASSPKYRMLIDIAHKQRFWNDPARMQGKDKNQIERVRYMTGQIMKNASSLNAGIDYLKDEINLENLKNCSLLFIHIPSARYQPGEIKAITEYLQNGGSLFLAMDEDYWSTLEQTAVNEIIEPFDIQFGGQSPDTVSGGYTKAGIITPKALKITFSGGRIIKGGTPFCFDKQAETYPFAVFKELKNGGRIIVMGDGMVSLYMTSWKEVNDYQCLEFMHDAFRWLLK